MEDENVQIKVFTFKDVMAIVKEENEDQEKFKPFINWHTKNVPDLNIVFITTKEVKNIAEQAAKDPAYSAMEELYKIIKEKLILNLNNSWN